MGLRNRIWQAQKADYARAEKVYFRAYDPLAAMNGGPQKTPTPVSAGVRRTAERLAAARKAQTKRLAKAGEPLDPSRQVQRQMERRRYRMPVDLSQDKWHRAMGFPSITTNRRR